MTDEKKEQGRVDITIQMGSGDFFGNLARIMKQVQEAQKGHSGNCTLIVDLKEP